MNRLIKVADLHAIKESEPTAVNVLGLDLVLLRHDDQITLFEGRCPHQDALLGEGEVREGALVCRVHEWRFDAQTGKRLDAPDPCLKKFNVITDEYAVWVSRGEILCWQAQQTAASKSSIVKHARPRYRTIDELPGPKGLPLIGNIHQIDLTKSHLIYEKWYEEFGPIYKIRFGPRTVVVIGDAKLDHQLLVERPDVFRRMGSIESVFKGMGIDGVFSAEGDTWRRQRPIVMSAFANKHLKNFFPTMTMINGRFLKKLQKVAHTQEAVDVQSELMRFTVDVTTLLSFNYDINTIENDGDVIQEHLDKIFPKIQERMFAPIPYWRYFKLPSDRRLDKALAAIDTAVDGFIQEARQRLEQSPSRQQSPNNFLEAFITAEGEDGTQFTDAEIKANVVTLLLAGEDTTANTMSWMMHFMLEHPEVQQKMQAEVDELWNGGTTFTEVEDLQKLKYIEAVAHETLRIKPVAPVNPTSANQDVELDGLFIPARTHILSLGRIGLLQGKYEAAYEFRPERWLTGELTPQRLKEAAYTPFGSGPRFCPGRNLAMMEIKMVMTAICRTFDLLKPPDALPVEDYVAFTMMPKNLRVQFQHRQNKPIANALPEMQLNTAVPHEMIP